MGWSLGPRQHSRDTASGDRFDAPWKRSERLHPPRTGRPDRPAMALSPRQPPDREHPHGLRRADQPAMARSLPQPPERGDPRGIGQAQQPALSPSLHQRPDRRGPVRVGRRGVRLGAVGVARPQLHQSDGRPAAGVGKSGGARRAVVQSRDPTDRPRRQDAHHRAGDGLHAYRLYRGQAG